MTSTGIHRETAEYRDYYLQVTYTPPQVVPGAMQENRPKLALEKQVVRRWDEEETPKRAKNEDRSSD
jgi:hypothetical protein